MDTSKTKIFDQKKEDNPPSKASLEKESPKGQPNKKSQEEKKEIHKNEDEKSENDQKENVQADKLQELTELLQRTQANFENYRKQMEARMVEMAKIAGKQMITQLLPVIDNFELALKNMENVKDQKHFAEGIQLIYTQLKAMLENNGVKEIETQGKMFDPYLHEALLKEMSSLPENTILGEYQKGYFFHGRVLRHARVKISAGKNSAGKKVDDGKESENKEK